jgi:hypothetical protein
MLAISMAMVGCGGGSGGNTGSNSGGTDGANDGGTSPQPVTCSETQYLQEGICKNKTAQRFEPLQLHRFLKGQAYQLNLKTDQDLTSVLAVRVRIFVTSNKASSKPLMWANVL